MAEDATAQRARMSSWCPEARSSRTQRHSRESGMRQCVCGTHFHRIRILSPFSPALRRSSKCFLPPREMSQQGNAADSRTSGARWIALFASRWSATPFGVDPLAEWADVWRGLEAEGISKPSVPSRSSPGVASSGPIPCSPAASSRPAWPGRRPGPGEPRGGEACRAPVERFRGGLLLFGRC